jgi:hypothetical protein
LIIGALPAGLAMGAAAWLLVGGPSLASANIALFEQQFEKAVVAAPQTRLAPGAVLSEALSSPLFALTTGQGAVTDLVLRLDGIARTPRRSAALISIGGQPAEWLEMGQTRDDVTLQEVQASKVVVDTVTGFKTVELGETTSPPAKAPDQPQGAAGQPSGPHMPLPGAPAAPR